MRAFEHPVTHNARSDDRVRTPAFNPSTVDQGDQMFVLEKDRDRGRRRRDDEKKHVRFDPRDRDDWS